MSPAIDPNLLQRGIRLNATILACTMGLFAGLGLFVFTHLSVLLTGDAAGRYLNLLGVFLPGYQATPEGAWFGLLWGFFIGALSGGFIYITYARSIRLDPDRHVIPSAGTQGLITPPTLRMSGHALGLALGAVMAIQLATATAWLVIRGTAHESHHAKLLAHYLPGYDVSFTGALIGAVDLFVVTYGLAAILAWTYNRVAGRNNRNRPHE